jgi:hypothetical protein
VVIYNKLYIPTNGKKINHTLTAKTAGREVRGFLAQREGGKQMMQK